MTRATRSQPTRTKPRKAPVRLVRPGVDRLHPLVRREALRLAKGDALRVEVIDETNAIVR